MCFFSTKLVEKTDLTAEIEKLNKEKIDVTLPGKEFKTGHVHPITQTIHELEDLFSVIGSVFVSTVP